MKNKALLSLLEEFGVLLPDNFADTAQGLFDVRRDDNRAGFNCAGGFKNMNAIRIGADWNVTGTFTHVLYGQSSDQSISIVTKASQNRLTLVTGICRWEAPLDGSGAIQVANSQSTGELMITIPLGTRVTNPGNWSAWGQSFVYVRDQP
jgi:hypothetical protein